jgi:hypothetical protein
MVTMVWAVGRLRLRTPLAFHLHISPLTSSGRRNRASRASQTEKSVTLRHRQRADYEVQENTWGGVTGKFCQAVLFFWWQIREYSIVNLQSRVSNPLVSWRRNWKVLEGFASVHWRNIWRCPTLAFQMSVRNLNDMKMICSWMRSTRPQTWFPYHNFLFYPELPTWYTKMNK